MFPAMVTPAARSASRIVLAFFVSVMVSGCQVPRRLSALPASETSVAPLDMAMVTPQRDTRIGGFIEKFDDTDVTRYLGGWGVRPKIQEIGVESGAHTVEVGYYDCVNRRRAEGTATVRFWAKPGHLYEIHMAERWAIAKIALTVFGARNATWTAWAEDAGPVGGSRPLTAPVGGSRTARPARATAALRGR
jgi:hypothetical protein